MSIPGVMTKFKLRELSGVRSPAQPPALAAIIKRMETGMALDPFIKREFSDKERQSLADSGKALPDGSFPIENEEDLHNAIRAVGRAKDEAKAKAHIISRAKSMGAEGALPDDWKVSKAARFTPLKGNTMTAAELRKSLGLAESASDVDVQNALIAGINKANDDKEEAEKRAKKAEDDAKADKAKAEKADRRAKMTEAEKAHTSNMSDDDCDDFMSKSEAERKKLMTKSADETLVVAGVSVRKSDVGDTVYAVLKAQQIQIDSQDAALKKAAEEVATAGFLKRAQSDFSHLPGTVEETAALLKSIASLPKEQGDAIIKNMELQEKLAKSAFSMIGKSASDLGFEKAKGDEDDAEAELEKKAKELEKSSGMTFAKSYAQVCNSHPELYAKFKDQQRVKVAKANGGAVND